MKRGSKVALIVAGALIVTGGAVFALAWMGTNPIVAAKSDAAMQTHTAEAPVTSLGIDVGSGTVTIDTCDGNDVWVEYSEGDSGEWEISQHGGALTVTQHTKPTAWLTSLFDFTHERTTVHLPESFAGDVTITSGSGSVTASGFEAGTLAISGGSGKVELADISAQSVAVVGNSGSIRLNAVSAADGVTISGGSGSISLSLVSAGGALIIDGGSGSVRMDSVSAQASTVNVSSGSVRFDRLAATDISIDTGSGSVRGTIVGSEADYSVTYSDSDGEYSHAGSGSGSLTVDVGSGSVDIDFIK